MASPSDDATSLREHSTDDRVETSSEDARTISDRSDRTGSLADCRWKTDEFFDRECSRYFDCPSHIIVRRMETDEQGEAAGSPGRDTRESSLYDPPSQGSSRPASSASARTRSILNTPELPQQLVYASSNDPQQTPVRSEAIEQHRTPRMEGEEEDTQPIWSSPTEQRTSTSSIRAMHSSAQSAVWPPVPPTEAPLPETPLMRRPTSRRNRRSLPGQQPGYYEHALPPVPRQRAHDASRRSSDAGLPRWQPDAEVTYCPICQTQFSFFIRKHHCRKCGRVVCNACSPHKIIIPHQYIVRQPGSEIPMPQSLLMDGLGVGYVDVNGMSGGDRVRLCNPCVPDPNISPPQSSTSVTPAALSPRSSHTRSRSSIGNTYGSTAASNRYGMVLAGPSNDPFQQGFSMRNRSMTMSPGTHAIPGSSSRRPQPGHFYTSAGRSMPSYPPGRALARTAPRSSRQRDLPPTPQIPEEDECPICHRELPPRTLPNFEAARESHINTCIQSHSTYGSPRPALGGETSEPAPAPRRTGMYAYPATEKDCVDDAECTICLEEFTAGVQMARLECLCRFHHTCIAAWFANHPGRCPVHQHDGFGY